MSALRTSPSPSPSPVPGNTNTAATAGNNVNKVNARASLGPQSRTAGNASSPSLALPSPRPGGQAGGGRPTSELLGSGGANLFQTPEAEAIDQWFENLQNYEATLEEMAAASLDINFKEELSAIEQWFRVLSEAERTAALYSLLQQSTQVQIRFFITVLQQMARSDPMTALLSPAAGGSMQSQMEAKLATLGLKTPTVAGSFPSPASPSARNFGRQSLAAESPAIFTPDSSNNAGANSEAAATLAERRAQLQSKTNANHRISAPALANSLWSPSATGKPLGQVAEQEQTQGGNNSNTLAPPTSAGGTRPKSMDLSSLSNLRNPRGSTNTAVTSDGDSNDVTMSPIVGGNWASMVNTPAAPMFDQAATRAKQDLDAATMKLYNTAGLNAGNSGGNRFVLEDAKAFRRQSKGSNKGSGDHKNAGVVYDNDGNPLPGVNQTQPGLQQRGNNRNHNNHNQGGGYGWNGGRSPALSGRFDNNGGMPDASMLGFGLGSPGLMNMNMNMMNPNMMNPNMLNMGMLANLNALAAAGITSPDAQAAAQAQLFAAQMAALSGQPGMMGGLAGFNPLAGVGVGGGYRSPVSGRMGGSVRSPTTTGGGRSTRGGGGDRPDEEVDPKLLEDVPAWLRSLRLHKYTPNFEGMAWRQMVILSEQQLEEKGVAALGARRKMLKTFEHVRTKMGIPHPEGMSPSSGVGASAAAPSTAQAA